MQKLLSVTCNFHGQGNLEERVKIRNEHDSFDINYEQPILLISQRNIETAPLISISFPNPIKLKRLDLDSNARTIEIYVDGNYQITLRATENEISKRATFIPDHSIICSSINIKFFSLSDKSKRALLFYGLALVIDSDKIVEETKTIDIESLKDFLRDINLSPNASSLLTSFEKNNLELIGEQGKSAMVSSIHSLLRSKNIVAPAQSSSQKPLEPSNLIPKYSDISDITAYIERYIDSKFEIFSKDVDNRLKLIEQKLNRVLETIANSS
ncbi:uncharacterized protein VTP21DRAFT_6315 [Calcarisporiella thermophila]|uniref:uncharacterized protein n=1 Tax=Calcarisporiella thermophila TaxID=911321 RepID=UPI003742EC64